MEQMKSPEGKDQQEVGWQEEKTKTTDSRDDVARPERKEEKRGPLPPPEEWVLEDHRKQRIAPPEPESPKIQNPQRLEEETPVQHATCGPVRDACCPEKGYAHHRPPL